MIKKSKKILFTVLLIAAGMLLMVLAAGLVLQMKTEKPEEILRAYFSAVEEKDYESMYQMVDPDTLINLDKEGFIAAVNSFAQGSIEIPEFMREWKPIISVLKTFRKSAAGERLLCCPMIFLWILRPEPLLFLMRQALSGQKTDIYFYGMTG